MIKSMNCPYIRQPTTAHCVCVCVCVCVSVRPSVYVYVYVCISYVFAQSQRAGYQVTELMCVQGYQLVGLVHGKAG